DRRSVELLFHRLLTRCRNGSPDRRGGAVDGDRGIVLPLGGAVRSGRRPRVRPGGARRRVVPQRDVDDVRELELRDPRGEIRRQLRQRCRRSGGWLPGRGRRPEHVRRRGSARDPAHPRCPAAQQRGAGGDAECYRTQRLGGRDPADRDVWRTSREPNEHCTLHEKGLGGAAVPIIRTPGVSRGPYPAGRGGAMSEGSRVRLDRWLWAARFFKTRALAAAAIGGGKIEVGGARAKRAKLLSVGDRLRIRRGPFEYRVVGRALAEHPAPPAAAAALYEEDAEGRRLREQLAEQLRVAPSLRYEGKGRPTKRERREIERLRGE